MDRRLLVRPLPLRGEGLRGYFLRVADANGLLPGLDLYGSIRIGRERGGALSRTVPIDVKELGLDETALASLGCRALAADETRRQHVGHKIALRHLRARQCAVCPRCLAAQPAIWADWELVAQIACPDHQCWLVDSCPQCGDAIGWHRRGVVTCQCGFDLRQAKTTAAPAEVISLAGALRHRLFGDLSTRSKLLPAFVPFVWNCSFNEFLGMFSLFHASRMQDSVGQPVVLANATKVFGVQAAVATAVATMLAGWPSSWERILDNLALAARPHVDSDACLIVNVAEALAPYHFLVRPDWSPAAQFPSQLRSGIAGRMRKFRIWVGPRRFFVACDRGTPTFPSASVKLKRLWNPHTLQTVRMAQASDRLSAAALRELFKASEHQLRALRRVGVLPKGPWLTVREVDEALAKLAEHSRVRRPTIDRDMVPLSDFSFDEGDELEEHLRRVLAGQTPSVVWPHARSVGLNSICIPERYADLRLSPMSEQS